MSCKNYVRKSGFVLLLFLSFLVAGCGSQERLTGKDFTNKMEERGFKVVEASEEAAEYDDVKTIFIASNGSFQIEYYELANEKSAMDFYNDNKRIIAATYAGGDVQTTNDSNSQKFAVTTTTNYGYIARNADTCILVLTDKNYKNSVDSIINTLGY